jgi:hypothetical protein
VTGEAINGCSPFKIMWPPFLDIDERPILLEMRMMLALQMYLNFFPQPPSSEILAY